MVVVMMMALTMMVVVMMTLMMVVVIDGNDRKDDKGPVHNLVRWDTCTIGSRGGRTPDQQQIFSRTTTIIYVSQ